MSEEFITYQKYSRKEEAFELGVLLKENNIAYIIEESPTRFNVSFVSNDLEKEFTVKLKKEDFERAEKLVEKIILEQINSIQPDYYLYEYTNDELIEIIKNKYEWNKFDFLLAQKILKERGRNFSPQEIDTFKEEHVSILSVKEKSSTGWIITGYVFAFVGGLFAIAIGWHLFNYKKTLPTGDVMYVHSESDRKHGVIIFAIGIVVFTLSMITRFILLFVTEN